MEDVPIAYWSQWLARNQAHFHPDRGSAEGKWQVYYLPARRAWAKVTRISQTHMRAEFSSICPCRYS